MRSATAVIAATTMCVAMLGVPSAAVGDEPGAAPSGQVPSGRLLYASGSGGTERGSQLTWRDLDGTAVANRTFGDLNSYTDWRQSPDGTMLAEARTTYCSDASCEGTTHSYRVVTTDGSTLETAALEGWHTGFTWLPDQTALIDWVGFDGLGVAFYRVPLDGSEPTVIYETPPDVVLYNGYFDISPDGTSIATVGARRDVDGRQGDVQLFSIDVASGELSDYSVPLPGSDCADRAAFCRELNYTGVTWAADGESMTVPAFETSADAEGTITIETFIGSVSPGDAEVERLLPLYTYQAGEPFGVGAGSLKWLDQDHLLWTRFDRDTESDADGEVFLLNVGTSDSTALSVPPGYQDWQGCPDGVCVEWAEDPVDPLPSTVALSVVRKATRVKATAVVSPDATGAHLWTSMQRKRTRSASWKVVEEHSTYLQAVSSSTWKLGLPRGFKCRVVSYFHGNDELQPSWAVKRVRCR